MLRCVCYCSFFFPARILNLTSLYVIEINMGNNGDFPNQLLCQFKARERFCVMKRNEPRNKYKPTIKGWEFLFVCLKVTFFGLHSLENCHVGQRSPFCKYIIFTFFFFLHFCFAQEIQNKQKMGPTDETPRKGPESLPVGHHDIITDIATFQTTQGFIVTASRDGIVKVWK